MSDSFTSIVATLEEAKDGATYSVDGITNGIALQRENVRSFFLSPFRAVILGEAKTTNFNDSNQGHAYCPEETTRISASKKYSFLSNEGSENSNPNKVAPPTPPRLNIPAEKESPVTPPRRNLPV